LKLDSISQLSSSFASMLLIQMNGAWKMVSTVGVWTHNMSLLP
jgi:hypothetical protein